jgi:hypothetical protein
MGRAGFISRLFCAPAPARSAACVEAEEARRVLLALRAAVVFAGDDVGALARMWGAPPASS